MTDVIWALDRKDRCLACPSVPVANAVLLHLTGSGELPREAVERWAHAGVMAAGIAWPGVEAPLTEDDRLELEDALLGLHGLAGLVAVVGEVEALPVAEALARRDAACGYAGLADVDDVVALLREKAPV